MGTCGTRTSPLPKKQLKEASSMSIIRGLASYSMTRRWKMSCAFFFPYPLLCRFALSSLSCDVSFAFSGVGIENAPGLKERLRRSIMGSFALLRYVPLCRHSRSSSRSDVLLVLYVCVGAWGRSICLTWSRCGPRFRNILVVGLRNGDFRDRWGPYPVLPQCSCTSFSGAAYVATVPSASPEMDCSRSRLGVNFRPGSHVLLTVRVTFSILRFWHLTR